MIYVWLLFFFITIHQKKTNQKIIDTMPDSLYIYLFIYLLWKKDLSFQIKSTHNIQMFVCITHITWRRHSWQNSFIHSFTCCTQHSQSHPDKWMSHEFFFHIFCFVLFCFNHQKKKFNNKNCQPTILFYNKQTHTHTPIHPCIEFDDYDVYVCVSVCVCMLVIIIIDKNSLAIEYNNKKKRWHYSEIWFDFYVCVCVCVVMNCELCFGAFCQ